MQFTMSIGRKATEKGPFFRNPKIGPSAEVFEKIAFGLLEIQNFLEFCDGRFGFLWQAGS